MNVRKERMLRKVAALAVLPTALLGVSGCANTEDDLPALVEETETSDAVVEGDSGSVDTYDNYTGVYDSEFFDNVEFYVGEEITLAAIVGEVISPNMFTVISSTNPPEQDVVDVDAVIIEPLLVVHREEIPELAAGMPVGVTGVIHEEFYPATVEQDLEVNLGNEAFGDWEEQAYVEAISAAPLTTD